MNVSYRCSDSIPTLGWCLTLAGGRGEVVHGSMVETHPDFFTDGVWAGKFEDHRFDREFLAGTGGILARDHALLVGSSAPVDRVLIARDADRLIASNSLPFLLEELDDSFDPSDLSYRNRMMAVEDGVHIAPKWLRTARGRRIRVLFDEVASVSAQGVSIRRRPPHAPFRDFADYRDTLQATLEALFENAGSAARSSRFDPTVSMSAGYDSVAVAALGAQAGMRDALTMRRPLPDDPAILIDHPGVAAAALGLELQEVERGRWKQRTDLPDADIAAAGVTFMDVAMIALESELPGRLLLVGHSGDNVWGKGNFRYYDRDIVQSTGTISGRGFAEYRLRVGFVMVPIAFMGHTAHGSLYRISNSTEMAPWSVGGSYDRPIARRIAEEAGVPRDAFGIKKYAGSGRVGTSRTTYRTGSREQMRDDLSEFMTEEGIEHFLSYLERNLAGGAETRLGDFAHWLYHKLAAVNVRVGGRLHHVGIKGLVPRQVMLRLAQWGKTQVNYTSLLPHWGVEELKSRYRATQRPSP